VPAEIVRVVTETFDQNTYLVWAPGEPTAVVVDPGFDTPQILNELRRRNLGCAAVLLTHGHVDHIAGVAAVKQAFPLAPVVIGTGDAAMLTDAELNLSAAFGVPVTAPPADRLVTGGDELTFAGLTFAVADLPGHSPGHVVYHIVGELEVLGGDVLFAGGVGRTDFPGGSHAQLVRGIREVLWPLPDETTVHPGHGPATTIGAEKRTNPFID